MSLDKLSVPGYKLVREIGGWDEVVSARFFAAALSRRLTSRARALAAAGRPAPYPGRRRLSGLLRNLDLGLATRSDLRQESVMLVIPWIMTYVLTMACIGLFVAGLRISRLIWVLLPPFIAIDVLWIIEGLRHPFW
jgi:hypothetical protein